MAYAVEEAVFPYDWSDLFEHEEEEQRASGAEEQVVELEEEGETHWGPGSHDLAKREYDCEV